MQLIFSGQLSVLRWEKLQAWAAKSRNCCSLISSSRTWSQTSNIERHPVRSRWSNPQATFHTSTYFYKHLQTSKGTCRKARVACLLLPDQVISDLDLFSGFTLSEVPLRLKLRICLHPKSEKSGNPSWTALSLASLPFPTAKTQDFSLFLDRTDVCNSAW